MNEETLFQEALSRSPEERAAFLDQACVGRPELRAAVEALLAAHHKTGNILDKLPAQTVDSGPGQARPDAGLDPTSGPGLAPPLPATKTADYRPISETGIVIAGHYTLEQKIGEGGMGEVWVAKQTEPVKRRVALKLIKTGMDSKAVVQRFEQERQALALMDHPHIAKVLDGGLTPTGQPFFVMELVNGLPLTRFCDEARLTTKERLELFVPICQAVQHAHQKGIVHRDLKPANILVTMIDGKPVPKVIDFGVAKATAGKLTDESMSTQFGAVVGTLEYMSPEQAGFSGVDVDTRADIYSLGVILYELLTGLRPIDARRLKAAALTEMIRIIREEEPLKPSTRLSTDDSLASMAALRQIDPRKLMSLLRGELDWIVMKCLEKQRDRRYETAISLAKEIQRYLEDEPVEARPPSAGYRLHKFVRRHRGKVIAASLVLLALLAGMAGTTWGLIREARANTALAAKNDELSLANGRVMKANADLSAANAKIEARYNLAVEAIKTFHTGVSEDFLLKEEKFKELRDRLLKSAADFYGKLGALLGQDTNIASRRALAQSNFELAELTWTVGRNEDALAAHRAVLAAREALAAEPGAGALAKVDVGRSLIAVAGLLRAAGQTDEALATYRRSESLLAGPAGADPSARAALAACRSQMGWLLKSTGKSADALAAYRLARADQEALAAAPEASNDARYDLANTIKRIGALLGETGKRLQEEAEYRRALEIFQKLADDNPAVTKFRSGLGAMHINLGFVLEHTDRPSEAEAEFRKGLALYQKLADDNPAVIDFRSDLAWSHDHLGWLLWSTGKLAEAEAEERNALALYQRLADDNPAVTDFRLLLAQSHFVLGHVLSSMGKPVAAEAEYRESLAIRQKLADDNPAVTEFRFRLATSHGFLAGPLSKTGKPAEAEAEQRKSMALYQKLVDDEPVRTDFRHYLSWSHRAVADLLSKTGKPAEAEAEYRKALAIRQKLVDDNPAESNWRSDLADFLFNHGILLSGTGKPAEAEAEYRKAVAIRQKLVDDNPSDIGRRDGLAYDYMRVAALQAWFGQNQELSSTCEKLLSLAKDTEDPAVADKAAKCCSLRQADPKRRETALVLAREAVDLGKDHSLLPWFQMALGMTEYRSGHFAEADAALIAAATSGKDNPRVVGTSAFYRAMGLFRQGMTDLARKLATEAAAKMKPLPVDEQRPLLGGADENDLIMWLAYKEAKAMLKFEATQKEKMKH
jgi:eukaryotic-like serine/threonine-protein kinase